MIIATPKPLDELFRILSSYSRILVAGCQTCVTIGRVGGEENVKAMISALEIVSGARGQSFQFEFIRTPRQCEEEMLESTKGVAGADDRFDAILSFGCASGVQVLADSQSIPVIPALNTRFIGSVNGTTHWENRCIGCGDCFLHMTGGICVLARCPRSMRNGSCGYESLNGKCDVNPKRQCVWDIIRGRHSEYVPARNWSLSAHGGVSRLPQIASTDPGKSEE